VDVTSDLDRNAIGHLLAANGADAWGVAANEPALPLAPPLPRAIAIVMRLKSEALVGVSNGPTSAYLAEYERLNTALNDASVALATTLRAHGHETLPVPPTGSSEGVFPHKTAATRAGLGWIGKTALFVSAEFGPAVRLASVFTDLDLAPGEPVTRGRCAGCAVCVQACPAGAGRDVDWVAGMARSELFDHEACRRQLDRFGMPAQICGICIAVCPLSENGKPARP
jgi:epoxyqueuosine reductase QueG